MIDKLHLFTDDFEVGEKPLIKIGQGNLNQNTRVLDNYYLLYTDKSGNDIYGSKAYRNTEFYNMDIKPGGKIYVRFNPSKVVYGNNFNLIDSDQLKIAVNQVQEDLKDSEIYIDLNKTKISRIDLCKNINTDQPVNMYGELFNYITGKRMTKNEYPSGWLFKNGSREICFYDKIRQLLEVYKIRPETIGVDNIPTMRGEIRVIGSRTVKRDVPYIRPGELYNKSSFDELEYTRKHLIKDIVFNSSYDDKLKFNFKREVDLLRALKQETGRGAVGRFIQSLGAEQILERLGSLENFRTILLEVGYHEKSTYRYKKMIKDLLDIKSKVDKKHDTDTITNLYEEITNKFLN